MEFLTELKCMLTRDSVCMADDIYSPHQLEINLCKYDESEQLLKEILSRYSLPALACWFCYLNKELFAIIKFDCKEELTQIEYKYLKSEIEMLHINFIHFKYDSACTSWC